MHGFEFSQTSVTIKSHKITLPLLQVKLENISKNQGCSKLPWGRAPPPRRELPPSPEWPHMAFTHFYYYLLMSDQYIVCNYLIVIWKIWNIFTQIQYSKLQAIVYLVVHNNLENLGNCLIHRRVHFDILYQNHNHLHLHHMDNQHYKNLHLLLSVHNSNLC